MPAASDAAWKPEAARSRRGPSVSPGGGAVRIHRTWSRSAVGVLTVALAALSCSGSWPIRREARACVIREGMTTAEVHAACGAPTGAGTTPEVWQRSGCSMIACSAPGDLYEKWLVRYGCDRRVIGVDAWPTGSFVESR